MQPATLNRLAIAAQVWLGTPFYPHGKTPGPDGGCSCQTLAAAVYIEAGVLPEGFEIPVGPIETGFEPMRDALNTWLAKYFAPVESRQAEAGDLMLFKIGRQGHMGISLGNRFIHCLRPAGVKMSRSDDATFLKRLVGVWRPKENVCCWCAEVVTDPRGMYLTEQMSFIKPADAWHRECFDAMMQDPETTRTNKMILHEHLRGSVEKCEIKL